MTTTQKAKSETLRVALTKRFVESMPTPAEKDRVYVFDTKTPALAVVKTRSGATSFYLYKRIAGRPARVRLGGFPELTVEQARDLCAEKNLLIRGGADLPAIKRAARDEMTFGELFKLYIDNHAKSSKRTWASDEWTKKKHLTAWDNRQLSTIDLATVANLHARLGSKNGKYAANRVVELVQAVFKYGVGHGYAKENPALGIKAFEEESRERYLQRQEMPRFMEALNAEPNEGVRDCFLMCLLTGARRGNVQSMRWEELDLPRCVWQIPAAKTKNGKGYTVPLCPPAVEILARREASIDGDWVLPSSGKTGHLVELKGAWAKLLKRAKIKDLRIHDLRRTLGSWQAEMGVSLAIIGKGLGHTSQSATAIYARLQTDPVRLAVNSAVQEMFATVQEQKALPKKKGGSNGTQ